ncbi:MAG: 23S rRNA (pseudouridine(1915)-N(3))-methyltransferase RlmH [Bacteroidaceae bacterium]|nr:23S rRNA (pseudouridine(1915)-N(3))-methyltransferase RlmH [Bacteroidaceae bacterium]
MKITLLVVGKTTDPCVQRLVDEYASRLSHYIGFDIEVIPELRATKALTTEQQKAQEAALIRRQVQAADHVVLLDEHGKEYRSLEFASMLQKRMSSGIKRLLFIVGGPYGFDDSVRSLAKESISLSKMTFSHQLIRLLFVEQLYRAFTIINHEPYHHE